MDVSAYDRTPDSTIVDLRETTSNGQYTCSSHSDSLPVQSNNRTSVRGNISIDTTNRIYIRSGHNDSDKLNEIDVTTTAANIASVPEGCLWCWGGACTHTHPAGHHHQVSECTGGTHIFFNDCISSEDSRGSGNCRFHDTCDSGINTTSETTEILCDYASVCDDESIYIEAPSSLVCAEDRSKLLDNELVSCQKTDRLTAQSEDHKESHVVSPLTPGSAQRDSITTVSEALVGERTCSATMPISTVAAVYITSLLNQTSKMSECLLPANRDFIHDVQQPPSAVCIPPPKLSPLVSTDPSTLPPVSFPPIFYINMDETLPLNVCVTEKQNAVLKSELANVNPGFPERCDSQLSTFSEKQDICRICHCEGDLINKLISPCLCSGSLKYIHLCCLQKWIKSSDKKSCELCNFDYIMTMKIRPFKQWERLDMTVAERRKIVCSVTFHIIAITCVIWSLYVLIDRTTEEVNAGTLDWPFWTKLIVVAIGFTGGLVFMYVQCKMYLQLCLRWRQYNKLINIENAPEDLHVRAEAAARIKARSNEAGGVVNTVALQEVDSF